MKNMNLLGPTFINLGKTANKISKHTILNTMTNKLYNVSKLGIATEIWDGLNKKHIIENARTKKYTIEKIVDFKIVETKLIPSQVDDFQLMVND